MSKKSHGKIGRWDKNSTSLYVHASETDVIDESVYTSDSTNEV